VQRLLHTVRDNQPAGYPTSLHAAPGVVQRDTKGQQGGVKAAAWIPIVAPDLDSQTVAIGDHVIRTFKITNLKDAPKGTKFRWDGGLGIRAPGNVEILTTQPEAAKFSVWAQARRAGETRLRAMVWAEAPGAAGAWSADQEAQLKITPATLADTDLTRISHGKARDEVDPMAVGDTLQARTKFSGVSKTATDYPVDTPIYGTGAKLLDPVKKAAWIQPGVAESTFKAVGGGGVDAQIWGRAYDEPGTSSPVRFQIQHVDLKHTDRQALEQSFKIIAGKYKYILMVQSNAIQEVWDAANHIDVPKVNKTFWSQAAELALTAAIGGIGGIVAVEVASLLKEAKVADEVGKVVADAMKDAAKAGVKMLLEGHAKAADEKDVRKVYFGAQKQTAIDMAKNQEEAFQRDQTTPITNSKDPINTAKALEKALEKVYDRAYSAQLVQTLDGWGVAQANQAFGKNVDPGSTGDKMSFSTDMGKVLAPEGGPGMTIDEEVYGTTSHKGVLGIRVNVDSGDSKKPISIERAEVQGWSSKLRDLMANRKIKDIRMPIALIGKVDSGPLKVGRSETGVLWLGNHRDRATNWLLLKAIGYGRAGNLDISKAADIDKGAFEGLRIVFNEELGEQTLAGKLPK